MDREFRIESDSLGQVQVENKNLWGAQTQRSVENFTVGRELMPKELIYALVWVKKAAAKAHAELSILEPKLACAIDWACDQILEGKYDDQFPLVIWQTGSGTQTHMNVNEVIANIASEKLGGLRGKKSPVHPNDHVNYGQSSNDIFPTAMHICLALQAHNHLLPQLDNLISALTIKEKEGETLVKTGRTHLMDAAPLTFGQVFSSFIGQLEMVKQQMQAALEGIYLLAIGGSAVGTGLNCHPQLAPKVCYYLHEWLHIPFSSAPNKFCALSGHEADMALSGTYKTLSSALFKMANDIRWLASGPRCSIGELILPENEPGSSIMPGKVNPTQCEALCMLCLQVLGNDVAVSMAGSQGNFELNVFKPLILHNIYRSAHLLAEGMGQFVNRCLKGLRFNQERIEYWLNQSLMLATALNKELGYDNASKIVRYAHKNGKTLKQSAVEQAYLTEAQFDEIVNPQKMLGDFIG